MTELKLYNTLTRQKEVFNPIDPDNVRMYVCGPTVYDFAHIGNARPVIVFDVLFRLLRHVYGNDHVTYVRNITDVDDKINARALRDFGNDIKRGKLTLNDAIRAVTEKTANQFHLDVEALGCLQPTVEPRATEYIDGMAKMIQTLIDKGHAYVASGREGREVLFDVAAMPEYGQLSKRKLEDQQAGARVAVEDHKKNPADFVLWKESNETEPGWDAEFDGTKIYGRPGWHIECSVMAKDNLGEVFDIHGGGLDLIFPHHENEIAQSRCAHGSDVMANVWMHNGYLQVEGRKMSKSEGNFVTIHDLLHTEKFGGRKWPGEVLRLAMLMTHYREPIDFSLNRLKEAREIFRSFAEVAAPYSMNPAVSEDAIAHLGNDLDTWNCIQTLFKLRDLAAHGDVEAGKQLFGTLNIIGFFEGKFTAGKSLTIPLPLEEHSLAEFMDRNSGLSDSMFLSDIFNHLQSKYPSQSKDITIELSLFANGTTIADYKSAFSDPNAFDDASAKSRKRLALLAEKNYAEADKIRDELLAQGIQLKDSKDPETGERITTWEIKR